MTSTLVAGENPEPYKTTDFYLAAYLRAAGYASGMPEFDGDSRRATFVFYDVPPQELVNYYNASETHRVSALGLIRAIRETRETLYNLR